MSRGSALTHAGSLSNAGSVVGLTSEFAASRSMTANAENTASASRRSRRVEAATHSRNEVEINLSNSEVNSGRARYSRNSAPWIGAGTLAQTASSKKPRMGTAGARSTQAMAM